MKAVIFDFDGTLADTFGMAVELFYELTGRGQVPDSEVERLRGLALRKAARELGISKWKMPLLLFRGRRRMRQKIEHIHAFPGVMDMLQVLHDEGYDLFIISSNGRRNIQGFLRNHHVAGDFTRIYANSWLWTKRRQIRRLLGRYGYKDKDVVYIGDEVGDVESAHTAGIAVIAVSWGFNLPDLLSEHHPELLADTPARIVDYIRHSTAKDI